MSAHDDDAPHTDGPGWATPEGEAARRLLLDARPALAVVYRACGRDPNAAILVGEHAVVAEVAGDTLPHTRFGAYAAVAVPVGVFLRSLLRLDAALVDRLIEHHESRGEGRAVVVFCVDGPVAVTRITFRRGDA